VRQIAFEHTQPEPAIVPAGLPEEPARQVPEMSGRTAARLLLAAGTALVAIAATIFTVAGWSGFGPVGRCAILLAVTALVLCAARPLHRRKLHATSEAIGAIGLVLTLGDAFLVLRATGLEIGLLAIAAFCAAMAAAWAAYGTASRLRGPRLAALGLAQLTAPFALAGGARLIGGSDVSLTGPVALGLVAAAAVDAACSAVRPAAAAAVATWTAGVLVAAASLVRAAILPSVVPAGGRAAAPAISPGGAAWLGLACAAAAAIGAIVPARRVGFRPLARPAAVISGALATLGLAIPAVTVLPARWAVAVTGALGFCISAAVLARRPAGRLELAAGSAAALAVATVITAPAALAALVPQQPVFPVWGGDASGAAGQLSTSQAPAATMLLALCAAWCLIAGAWRRVGSARFRVQLRAGAIVTAALAAGSLPAAAGLSGWTALTVWTAAAASLLIAGAGRCDRMLASVAVVSGCALAVISAAWSLATPAITLTELATLMAAFGVAAIRARHVGLAAVTTAGAFASTVGLAWAAPLAAGWPAGSAALAGFLAASAGIAVATIMRRVLPVHSVVLDLGAGQAALLSAAFTIGDRDAFTFIAVAAAVIASGTAWLRTGPRRIAAAAVAGAAALTALAASGRPLAAALGLPAHIIMQPWHGVAASRHDGLALAVLVLGACLVALVSAVGALHDSSRFSLEAAAAALPLLAAPAGVASLDGGLGYLAVTGALLILTLALIAWATCGDSLAPAGAALASAALTFAWALAAPAPTLIVLGGLAACFGLSAARARLGAVRIAAACLCVLTAGAFAECLAFATGLTGWQAGFAALAAGAAAQAVSALPARRAAAPANSIGEQLRHVAGTRAEVGIEIEITGWLVIAIGAGQCLGRPWTASAATAFAGLVCLGAAARPGRRKAAWAGLVLCYAAWCIGLNAAGIALVELYTGPAAVVALAPGWLASRREPRPHSWIAYGPGLAVALVPSLLASWDEPGWSRPLLLGLAAVIIAIVGARTRTQAPLITGAAVALLLAGRELAPDVVRLVHLLPGWMPVAVGGAVLLWAGATYEARLRNVRAVRRSLASLS
jgi:hypothetical protein